MVEATTEREAARRLVEDAERYAEETRRRADAFAEQRIRRMHELSDRLIATAETVEQRFGHTLELKRQLDDLAAALAAAAERAAQEMEIDLDRLPSRFDRVEVEDTAARAEHPYHRA